MASSGFKQSIYTKTFKLKQVNFINIRSALLDQRTISARRLKTSRLIIQQEMKVKICQNFVDSTRSQQPDKR